MQVALVTDTFPPDINGVSLTMERLRRGLQARGHRVSLIRPAAAATPLQLLPREMSVASLPVPGYPGLRFGLPSWSRLWRLWSKQRPDVVYVATEGPLGFAATRLARWLGIPVASGFHTNFHDYLNARRLPHLGKIALRYLRRLHNGTSLTLTPSHDVANHLQTVGFRNLQVLSRGVESGLFSPNRRDPALREKWGVTSHQEIVFLLVGRLAPEKNIPFALRELQQLAARGGRFRCVVVGDGPDREALAHAFPFAIFAGTQRGEDLARYYASADVLVFPSLTETFGNVLLEGMASGLLTISFDYAAAREHIVDGLNGWKVPFGNSDAFSRRLTTALRCSTSQRRTLGAAARRTAESLDWESIVRRFEELLTSTTLPPSPATTHLTPTVTP